MPITGSHDKIFPTFRNHRGDQLESSAGNKVNKIIDQGRRADTDVSSIINEQAEIIIISSSNQIAKNDGVDLEI